MDARLANAGGQGCPTTAPKDLHATAVVRTAICQCCTTYRVRLFGGIPDEIAWHTIDRGTTLARRRVGNERSEAAIPKAEALKTARSVGDVPCEDRSEARARTAVGSSTSGLRTIADATGGFGLGRGACRPTCSAAWQPLFAAQPLSALCHGGTVETRR
jgi:hypothetical protein